MHNKKQAQISTAVVRSPRCLHEVLLLTELLQELERIPECPFISIILFTQMCWHFNTLGIKLNVVNTKENLN